MRATHDRGDWKSRTVRLDKRQIEAITSPEERQFDAPTPDHLGLGSSRSGLATGTRLAIHGGHGTPQAHGKKRMNDSKPASEQLVRDFLGSWFGRDLEEICGYFDADAIYHNVPVAPITGIAGIRQIFAAFLDTFGSARLGIISLAAKAGLVLAERMDHFVMCDGTRVALPGTGVFEVRDGKIRRFSDYFDLANFERQSGMKL